MDSFKENEISPRNLLRNVILTTRISSAVPTPLKKRRRRRFLFSFKKQHSRKRSVTSPTANVNNESPTLASEKQLFQEKYIWGTDSTLPTDSDKPCPLMENEVRPAHDKRSKNETTSHINLRLPRRQSIENERRSSSSAIDFESLFNSIEVKVPDQKRIRKSGSSIRSVNAVPCPTTSSRARMLSRKRSKDEKIPDKSLKRRGIDHKQPSTSSAIDFDSLFDGVEVKASENVHIEACGSSDESYIFIHRDSSILNEINYSNETPRKSSDPLDISVHSSPADSNEIRIGQDWSEETVNEFKNTDCNDEQMPHLLEVTLDIDATRLRNREKSEKYLTKESLSGITDQLERDVPTGESSGGHNATKRQNSSFVIDPLIGNFEDKELKDKNFKRKRRFKARDENEGFFPLEFTKCNFNHFLKRRCSSATINAVNHNSNMFFKLIFEKLNGMMKVKGNNTFLDANDVIELFYKMKIFPESHSFNTLVRYYFPMEYQEILIPTTSSVINSNKQ